MDVVNERFAPNVIIQFNDIVIQDDDEVIDLSIINNEMVEQEKICKVEDEICVG